MPGLTWSSGKQSEVDQVQQGDTFYSEQDVTCVVIIMSEAEQRDNKHLHLQAPISLQETAAPALHQLPAPALAAIAEHLTSAEKLQLARLVFGKAHQDAAAAVLATVHSCNIKQPACTCQRTFHSDVSFQHVAGCCPASNTTSGLAALRCMGLLQQLSLQLSLQEQERHWPTAMSILSGLTCLKSLDVQLAGATCQSHIMPQHAQLQRHSVAARLVASLLHAIGHLQQCNHLALQLNGGPKTAASGAIILGPDLLQPLLHLKSLQSLSILTGRRLPTAALQQISMMPMLTSLQLVSSCKAEELVNMTAGSAAADSYESAAVQCLHRLCPQLHQLSLVGYFHQLQQQDSSSDTCLSHLLRHLNSKVLQQLDLSHNTSSPFPAAAAAVAALTSLQSLRLAGTAVTADVMALLGRELYQLEQLDISHTNAAAMQQHDQYGESVQPLHLWLPHCTALRDLRLQGRVLTVLDMWCIFALPQLQHLDIAGAKLSPDALAAALTSSSRRSVDSNIAKLVSLSLKDIRIGPDKFGSVKLERLSSLGELDLRGCRPGATAVAALRHTVPSLRVVLMEDLDWADEGLEWLIGDY